MKELNVEVIGSDPPCPRCRKTRENVERAASKHGVKVKITHLNASSREVVEKYGVLVTPALAVNGVIKTVGRIPSEEEVERILAESSK
ncbi:MAG: thioredoxin family protein [Candidatus Bathyarchaeia archaeon]|nr:thioredoxin family protein [Candidatus Bathyarchaeota archaeon]